MKLLDCLTTIVDPRRPQGRLYPLAPLLFVSVLAVLAGADSYRKIARFIDAHRPRLNAWLGLKWKRAPAHTAIRYAFLKLSAEALEAAFREHSAALAAGCEPAEDGCNPSSALCHLKGCQQVIVGGDARIQPA